MDIYIGPVLCQPTWQLISNILILLINKLDNTKQIYVHTAHQSLATKLSMEHLCAFTSVQRRPTGRQIISLFSKSHSNSDLALATNWWDYHFLSILAVIEDLLSLLCGFSHSCKRQANCSPQGYHQMQPVIQYTEGKGETITVSDCNKCLSVMVWMNVGWLG